jgi:hypothetical protein
MIFRQVFIILGIVTGSLIAIFLLYRVIMRIVRKIIHFPAPAFIGRFLDSTWSLFFRKYLTGLKHC